MEEKGCKNERLSFLQLFSCVKILLKSIIAFARMIIIKLKKSTIHISP